MTGSRHMADLVASAAQRWPSAPALIFSGGVLTYRELDRYVSGTVRALAAWTDTSRVALAPDRSWESVVVLLALLRMCKVVCLMSTRWPPRAIERAARQVGASIPVLNADAWHGLVQRAAHKPGGTSPVSEAPATLVHTSGSTAEPKAVLHSVRNHLYSARGANTVVPLARGDRWLLSLPLYHVAGLGVVFRCLVAGAAIVVGARAEATGMQLRHFRCTHASLVSTQLRRLLRADSGEASPHLRAVIVGGSSVPHRLLQTAHARGYPVCTTYGLTEMASQVTTLAPGAAPALLTTAGRVLPHRQLRIASDGEIQVKGPVLFQGYALRDTVRLPLTREGWFATGDYGRLDGHGYLHVEGRKDTLFISGGENIAPEAVERALHAIDGVECAIVVPIPDPTFGARPLAFVAGSRCWEHLAQELGKVLPRFMIPEFRPWPAQILHEGVKPDRVLLQKLALHGDA